MIGRLRAWFTRSRPATAPFTGHIDPADAATPLVEATLPDPAEALGPRQPVPMGHDDPPAGTMDVRCSEVLGVLQSYLDGEADEAMARQVADHLRRCPPCDQELRAYRRIKVSLFACRHTVDPRVRQSLNDFLDQVVRTNRSL
ncbi:MAG: anti-sigma factor family protein [Acidimicrobiales bacterium]